MIPRVLLRNVQVGTSYYIGLTNLVWRPFWIILVLHLQHVGKFLIVSFWFFVGEQILLYPFNNDTFKLRTKSDACLILLWNDYQVLGKDIYQTIFKRITDGQCPQRFEWTLWRVVHQSYVLFIQQLSVYCGQKPSEPEFSHHLPHAKPPLGELLLSHLQVTLTGIVHKNAHENRFLQSIKRSVCVTLHNLALRTLSTLINYQSDNLILQFQGPLPELDSDVLWKCHQCEAEKLKLGKVSPILKMYSVFPTLT